MNLESWLDYIQSLHATEIELGLDRVDRVARQMALTFPNSTRVITVAGTNGKGSCVALLEAILLAHGDSVGSYTSPHLLRYNERIRITGQEIDDIGLCDAFERVEEGRRGVPLTYFEFGTLAALDLFQRANLDVLVLEVGLGGRLDAVNIIDADVAVITSIDLDHMDWLGATRELIGREKAGIFRPGKPVVCAETMPPDSLLQHAKSLSAPVLLREQHYSMERVANSGWRYWGIDRDGRSLDFEELPAPALNPVYVATAIQAITLLGRRVEQSTLLKAIPQAALAGRFELIHDTMRKRNVVFDVAHNPAAAKLLAVNLQSLREEKFPDSKIVAVVAMMADKDTKGFFQALELVVDSWQVAQFDLARGLPVDELNSRLQGSAIRANLQGHKNVALAYQEACKVSCGSDLIVVTGSFITVAEVRSLV